VDIKEEKERYVLRADIPGVDPKEIEIIAENGVLTLRGNRPGETRDNRAGYSRIERPSRPVTNPGVKCNTCARS
jgi:HSP20 family protein